MTSCPGHHRPPRSGTGGCAGRSPSCSSVHPARAPLPHAATGPASPGVRQSSARHRQGVGLCPSAAGARCASACGGDPLRRLPPVFPCRGGHAGGGFRPGAGTSDRVPGAAGGGQTQRTVQRAVVCVRESHAAPPSEDERMSQHPPVAGRHLIHPEPAWEESRLRTQRIDGARLGPSLWTSPRNATCVRPASAVADRTHACPCQNRPAATSEAHPCSGPPEGRAVRLPRSAGRRPGTSGGGALDVSWRPLRPRAGSPAVATADDARDAEGPRAPWCAGPFVRGSADRGQRSR